MNSNDALLHDRRSMMETVTLLASHNSRGLVSVLGSLGKLT